MDQLGGEAGGDRQGVGWSAVRVMGVAVVLAGCLVGCGGRAETTTCEDVAPRVAAGSELQPQVVITSMGGTECVFGWQGEAVLCSDGEVRAPSRRQTVTIAADGTISVSEPEVESGCDPLPTPPEGEGEGP